MKKRYSFFLITLMLMAIVSSCKKDTIVSNDNMVGISKVTYYPNFEITGDENISIVVGTAYTDPGVKATAGGAEIPVTTTGSVDGSTVGVYILTYTATNKDGFSASATRNVFVIPSAEVPGLDLSGTYMTTNGTPNATVIKVAPGVYFTDNCWGNGSLAIIPAYFFCPDGTTPIIPFQVAGIYGRIMTTMPGTYSPSGLITWTIIREDFSPPLTLQKTWQKI
ncbi:MAG: DUF5011 domain-containing protein [Ginsengibacter sp.]